jgi:1,4-dihydroxy-2-naphthoate octaprenyltransferase
MKPVATDMLQLSLASMPPYNSAMPSARALVGVARAPFLLLPVTLVAAGAASASHEGNLDWRRTTLALLGLVALHVAVNALNEASDMATGIDLLTQRTPFSGGSGTLPSGAATIVHARIVGYVGAGVGLAVGVWFLARIGWTLLPVLVVGAVAVLGYTDWLARGGLGEVFAGLGLGAFPVWGTAYVQAGAAGTTVLAPAVAAFLMTFNLLLLNEFPDEAADRAGGRRNLVVLLGRQTAARVYAAATLLVPVVITAAVLVQLLPPLCLLAVVPTTLAARGLRWAFTDPEAPVPLPALGGNVVWNLTTNAALAACLALSPA